MPCASIPPRLAAALACTLLLAVHAHAAGADAKQPSGICSAMDIRNSPEQITKLEGCRVIEGGLSIVLMERANKKVFENTSFPLLREITGYLMLYRTKGVRNLGDLFPNLTVVRGMELFKDNAIVIFDNGDLEALGLRSLKVVERGGVRIERNDQLCYVNTIDWSRINLDDAENIVRSNFDTRFCGLCPNAQSRVQDPTRRQSLDQCPTDPNGKLLCWDQNHCQSSCPNSCGSRGCVDNTSECCLASCLGGCSGTPRNCHVCRNFSFGDGAQRTCVEHCPKGTYELFRRCVTESQCRAMPLPPPKPTEAGGHRFAPSIKAYKLYNNKQCVYMCPSGFMEAGTINNATCQPCNKNAGCVRECSAGKIDSVIEAEQYRGCTHIKGRLEISLRSGGGSTVSKLETYLGDIREISGGLQVTRSYPLVSLMFLKNLRNITGVPTPENEGKVLHILNNPNLELLWDWDAHGPVEISGGSLYIHHNSKLCYDRLTPLRDMTSNPRSNLTELEVSRESNGNQASCVPDNLTLTVTDLRRTAAVLAWSNYCATDIRKLLGYSIYYIATEHNVSLYDQRDACSDVWSVLDITIDEVSNNTAPKDPFKKHCKDNQPKFKLVTSLSPYTRYAAYVRTYTTQQDRNGAQSPIVFFRTLPESPSPPQALTVELLSAHSVYISWAPPARPNGTIIRYEVEVQVNSYNKDQILAARRDSTDSCSNPTALSNLIATRVEGAFETEKKATGDVKNGTCACEEEAKPETRFDERVEDERVDTIHFENQLQNWVYKKTDKSKQKNSTMPYKPKLPALLRHKRYTNQTIADESVNRMLVAICNSASPTLNAVHENKTEDNYVSSLYYTLNPNTRSLTVHGMRHFTWYTVNVWACRAMDRNESKSAYEEHWCSKRSFYTFLTLELANADVVENVQATVVPSNKTVPEVNVTWQPPDNPNGFVVAYNVHYSRVDEEPQGQDVGLQSCVMVEDYEAGGRAFQLRNLSPGNYSVKVTPITVRGPGNVSSDIYVYIPERTAESGYEWAWGVASGCLLMIVVLAGVIWYVKRGLLPNAEAHKLFASVNPEYVSTMYVPDEWEVPRANITFIRELGQGSFGMVYEGLAKNLEKGKPETRCAVKTVNEHATDRERIEFLNEASTMKAFDTFHVVRLMGVVSRGQPTLVVMELMELGDLKTYLRSHRPDSESSLPKKEDNKPPTLQNILQMAIEIADGMAYLSAKKFVHRDLAARNCMVAGDLTVKVGDFGMTRDIYETDYYRKGTKGLLPVRWMSPESLKDGVFSSSSDAWSYGVVLWEMATLAMQPYQGLSNEQVVRYVVEGGVMERPEHCPDRLYELMRACWAHRPNSRPSFLHLVADLAPSSAPYFRHRSFFHSPQGQEMYALQRSAADEEQEMAVSVGAVATGSGSNLFGVSGRLASWVRDLSMRSRASDDAAAEPLQPLHSAPTLTPKGPNGVLRDAPP